MTKKQKVIEEKQNLIDEIIELKIPDKEKRTPENISRLLQDLCDEVNELQRYAGEEDDDDEEKEPEEFIGRLNRDDFPDDMIPFVVVKKDSLFLDYKCPKCGSESKYSVKNFDKSPFSEYECPECKEKFLIKLNFEPELKVFVEANNG